jgi:hypothetical protein
MRCETFNRRKNRPAEDRSLAKAIWPQDHVSHPGTQMVVESLPGSETLARITMPFVDPALGTNLNSHFAAIHSNPPALLPTEQPAIVAHRFGKGRTLWVACGIEESEERVNQQLVRALLERILLKPLRFQVDAHPALEMTLFDQPEKSRLLAGLLNLQRKLPQVPVPATVRVLPPAGKRIIRVCRLPDRKEVAMSPAGPYVQFQVAPFDTLAMFILDYA